MGDENAGKSLEKMLEIIGPWMPGREIGIPPKRCVWQLPAPSYYARQSDTGDTNG